MDFRSEKLITASPRPSSTIFKLGIPSQVLNLPASQLPTLKNWNTCTCLPQFMVSNDKELDKCSADFKVLINK